MSDRHESDRHEPGSRERPGERPGEHPGEHPEEHPSELLSLHVDGELSDEERRSVEEHLDTCPRCRELVSDLEEIALRAASLSDRGPVDDLWPGIEHEIGRKIEADGGGGMVSAFRREVRVTLPRLAAAAVLVAAMASGVTWSLTRGDGATPAGRRAGVAASGTTDGAAPTARSAMAWAAAAATPQGVVELEARYRESRDALDPETRRTLDRNLELIDRAISEARQALMEEPDNSYLRQHLTRTMRRKAKFLTLAVRRTHVTQPG